MSVIHVEDTATTLRFVLCNITVDGSTQYKLPRKFRLTQQKADKYGIVYCSIVQSGHDLP